MTEVPEHLLKRAQAAKEKAAAKAAEPAEPAPTPRPPTRPRRRPRRQPHPRAPAGTVAVRQGQEGRRHRDGRRSGVGWRHGHRGGHRDRRWRGRDRGRPAARRRSGRAHPAPAHGGQVRLDPGRQGQAPGQGPRVAAPARRRVRRGARLHRLPADLLLGRQRTAAGAGELQPDAEPVQGAVVLPGSPGAAHDVPPDGRRCDHPGHGHLPADPGALHGQEPVRSRPRTASSRSRS